MPPTIAATANTIAVEPPLSEYEKLRLQKIARNNARLKDLGFAERRETANPKTTPSKKKKKTKHTVSPPERRSKRLSRNTTDLVMLSNEENPVAVKQLSDADRVTANEIPVDTEEYVAVPRRRSPSKKLQALQPLTESEQETLNKMDFSDFLPKFGEFLRLQDKISPDNAKSVMRQIGKLARGEGVRYDSKAYGWPEDCWFAKGNKITPKADILKLKQEAQDCEDNWGRDRGNGWLLSHPLQKLWLFQRFVLANPEFMKD